MTSSEITSHQICCSNKVALSSAVLKEIQVIQVGFKLAETN